MFPGDSHLILPTHFKCSLLDTFKVYILNVKTMFQKTASRICSVKA